MLVNVLPVLSLLRSSTIYALVMVTFQSLISFWVIWMVLSIAGISQQVLFCSRFHFHPWPSFLFRLALEGRIATVVNGHLISLFDLWHQTGFTSEDRHGENSSATFSTLMSSVVAPY